MAEFKDKETRHPGGRPPKLQDINEVEKKIKKYFEDCDDNPLIKNDFIRSGEMAGTIVPIPIQRPYMIEGLCLELGIDRKTYWNIVNRTTEQSQNDEELFQVLTHAHEKIRNQQISGAAGSLYNSNIVARYNNLKEQTDITSNNETITAINVNISGTESDN